MLDRLENFAGALTPSATVFARQSPTAWNGPNSVRQEVFDQHRTAGNLWSAPSIDLADLALPMSAPSEPALRDSIASAVLD